VICRQKLQPLTMKPINLVTLSLCFFIIPVEINPGLALGSDRPQLELSQDDHNLATLEQQAQQLYEVGRYQEAVNLLQQLENDYATQGDEVGQALTLRNLSLVQQELGNWTEAREAITQSFALLDTLQNRGGSNQATVQNLWALNWESLGQVELMTGNPDAALEHWQNATELFINLNNISASTRNQVNQVQALQSLGLYRQALTTLETIKTTLEEQPNNLVKAKSLQILGDALRVTGNLDQSQSILEQALEIAQTLNNPEAIANSLLSLANTRRLQGELKTALDLYEQGLKISSDLPLELQIALHLDRLSLLVQEKTTKNLSLEISQIEANLHQLSVSRFSVESRINLARTLISLVETETADLGNPVSTNFSAIAFFLAIAVQQAQSLNDPRTESYALGNLGYLYEKNQQWSEAQKLTNQALFLSQSIQANDIAYQWEWQRGRILYQQGDRPGAIAAYTNAVNILESLRTDLVSISSDAQFSFRESVEPVYRELVSILLEPDPVTPLKRGVMGEQKVTQNELVQARNIIESLQVAELDNFFRDACLDLQPAQIDRIDPNAAVFYTIILPDDFQIQSKNNPENYRLEVIVALPGQPLQHYTTKFTDNNLENTIESLRYNLLAPQRRRLSKDRYVVDLATVYDWLIRPIEANLQANEIETLVFVLDGKLRNVPMTTLYDGKQFLVEKYSVAIAPGLQLIDPKPLVSANSLHSPWEKLQILTAGLSEARQGFAALPGVEIELAQINSQLQGKQLLNDSFTENHLKQTIDSGTYSIVHLATHGEFSSKAEDTFVLTWDDRLDANELDNFLRNKSQRSEPIELLVLSACQTAVGDDRAVLGLAGVAVRAGARSTLASLWYVSDEATTLLMTEFYQELARSLSNNGEPITKAEAVRRAQLKVLSSEEFSHPYYWAAFVLVGNWL
jgi:CHAT domain-containing protein/predicted negative regulator of RcsB-dependent stress response